MIVHIKKMMYSAEWTHSKTYSTHPKPSSFPAHQSARVAQNCGEQKKRKENKRKRRLLMWAGAYIKNIYTHTRLDCARTYRHVRIVSVWLSC